MNCTYNNFLRIDNADITHPPQRLEGIYLGRSNSGRPAYYPGLQLGTEGLPFKLIPQIASGGTRLNGILAYTNDAISTIINRMTGHTVNQLLPGIHYPIIHAVFESVHGRLATFTDITSPVTDGYLHIERNLIQTSYTTYLGTGSNRRLVTRHFNMTLDTSAIARTIEEYNNIMTLAGIPEFTVQTLNDAGTISNEPIIDVTQKRDILPTDYTATPSILCEDIGTSSHHVVNIVLPNPPSMPGVTVTINGVSMTTHSETFAANETSKTVSLGDKSVGDIFDVVLTFPDNIVDGWYAFNPRSLDDYKVIYVSIDEDNNQATVRLEALSNNLEFGTFNLTFNPSGQSVTNYNIRLFQT